MLPKSLKQIIYSYIRDVNSIQYEKINKEIKDMVKLCAYCNSYKIVKICCRKCLNDCCLSCIYYTTFINSNLNLRYICRDNICLYE
jgi:hypothetical protein